MWFIPTKKEVKKEFKKIANSFKERDVVYNEIKKNYQECLNLIKELKDKTENNSLKIATLEGSYLILSQKNQSQSQGSIKEVSGKSQGEFETKMIKRIKQNKKSLVMAEIIKLIGSHSTQEIFETIVLDRKLCSKASFYRYLLSLKSQELIETKLELRQK